MQSISILLIAISIVGAISLPLGNPRFLTVSLTLEALYIILAILSFKYRYITIPCIIIATMVIIANTASPIHREIMLSMRPLENALILIIGGYMLQGMLILASILTLRKRHMERRINE